MNFYVIKIQNFCDRAKPWLGKVEALFHAIHPLLLGYEKRVCRNFDTPSFIYPGLFINYVWTLMVRAKPQFFIESISPLVHRYRNYKSKKNLLHYIIVEYR